ALAAAGDPLRKLAASAGQSAIFNAVLDARAATGLLHRVRPGDIACTTRGAPFTVTAEDVDDVCRRAAPGTLDAFATGPLPGDARMQPEPAVLAEEHAWSAATGVDWSWFSGSAPLASPGERRPLLFVFKEPPRFEPGEPAWLEFALPSGAYATEVLDQLGVAIPADRRG
nr:tRNA pseudouridine(13) synthase TruD [Planctomycetota bacterium]